jgi:hypothetical protein
MRLLYGFLFSCLLIFAGGCTAPEDSSRLESAADTASGLYQPGSLVRTKSDAIIVAGKLFEERGGIQWTASPDAVLTEQLSYAEAVKWIGVGDGEYERWPQETRVWFVVFKGSWLLAPFDPTAANPSASLHYEGCIFSLFTASDGELMAIGDSVCPPN